MTPRVHGNQCQAVLNVLRAAMGGEVPSYELARVALQYNSRLKELRAQGFNIKSRTERVGRQVRGYFRLESESTVGLRKSIEHAAAPDTEASLFGDLTVQARHRDDG